MTVTYIDADGKCFCTWFAREADQFRSFGFPPVCLEPDDASA